MNDKHFCQSGLGIKIILWWKGRKIAALGRRSDGLKKFCSSGGHMVKGKFMKINIIRSKVRIFWKGGRKKEKKAGVRKGREKKEKKIKG